jgi:hypothetical protein
MSKKLSQKEAEENVNERCKELNYNLIKPFIYNGKDTRIYLKCNIDNHEWKPTYHDFINGKRGCKICKNNRLSKLKTLSQEETEQKVKDRCKELNYTFKPFLYKGGFTKILLKCNIDEHKEWNSTYKNFITNKRTCLLCANTKKSELFRLSYKKVEENIQKICKELDYSLYETFIYINCDSKIPLICNKHKYKWNPTYDCLIYSNSGCPVCKNEKLSKLKTLSQDETEKKVNDRCKEINYSLIEPFLYKGEDTKITLKCNIKEHNKWTPTYSSFIYSNSKCPECGKQYNNSENKIKELLINNNFNFEMQYKPNWLKTNVGQQSLDFYLSEYNIAIEFQGLQHFQYVSIFGNKEKYNKSIERDIRKYNKCKEQGIKLLYVSDKRTLKSVPIDYLDKVYNTNELIQEINKLIK